MEDEILTQYIQKAVQSALEERKAAGLPIVRYDSRTKEIFHEMPDGTMIKVADARKKDKNMNENLTLNSCISI